MMGAAIGCLSGRDHTCYLRKIPVLAKKKKHFRNILPDIYPYRPAGSLNNFLKDLYINPQKEALNRKPPKGGKALNPKS